MAKRRRFGPYGFKTASLGKIPANVIGIYAFWHGGRCIYIGQAKAQSIKDRLWQHYKNCHNSTLDKWIDAYGRELTFCVFHSSYRRIDDLERKLIKRHQPRANVLLK
jgi:excinuclease UvrABC nuclease subunit